MEKKSINASSLLRIAQNNPISDLNIIDDCTIDSSYPEILYFENVSFQNLFVCGSDKLRIIQFKKCSFSKCHVNGDIKRIVFEEIINSEELEIEHGNILYLRIEEANLKSIGFHDDSEMKCKLDKVHIYGNTLGELNFNGEITECEIGGNKINSVSCWGNINNVKFSNKNLRGETLQNSHINSIHIRATNNSHFEFYFAHKEDNSVDIGKIIVDGNSNNSSIKINNSNINTVNFLGNFEEQSRIEIINSIINDELKFGGCHKIPSLQMNILDLSNTRFLMVNSYFSDLYWNSVYWPDNSNLYKPQDSLFVYDHAETIRRLKLQAKQQEDIFNKVKFTSLEFSAIFESIRGNKWNRNNKNWKFYNSLKWWINPSRDLFLILKRDLEKSRGDKFILYLNKYSNNFGLDWFRGVLFTLSSGLLFFFFYILTLKNPGFIWKYEGINEMLEVVKSFLPYYWKFIYAGHSFNFMESEGFIPNHLTGGVDLLGRIIIGFGYYQVIRAFRKFSN